MQRTPKNGKKINIIRKDIKILKSEQDKAFKEEEETRKKNKEYEEKEEESDDSDVYIPKISQQIKINDMGSHSIKKIIESKKRINLVDKGVKKKKNHLFKGEKEEEEEDLGLNDFEVISNTKEKRGNDEGEEEEEFVMQINNRPVVITDRFYDNYTKDPEANKIAFSSMEAEDTKKWISMLKKPELTQVQKIPSLSQKMLPALKGRELNWTNIFDARDSDVIIPKNTKDSRFIVDIRHRHEKVNIPFNFNREEIASLQDIMEREEMEDIDKFMTYDQISIIDPFILLKNPSIKLPRRFLFHISERPTYRQLQSYMKSFLFHVNNKWDTSILDILQKLRSIADVKCNLIKRVENPSLYIKSNPYDHKRILILFNMDRDYLYYICFVVIPKSNKFDILPLNESIFWEEFNTKGHNLTTEDKKKSELLKEICEFESYFYFHCGHRFNQND